MVVLVLITSCQVSENLKSGPEIAQININEVAKYKCIRAAGGFGDADEKRLKKRRKVLIISFSFLKFYYSYNITVRLVYHERPK